MEFTCVNKNCLIFQKFQIIFMEIKEEKIAEKLRNHLRRQILLSHKILPYTLLVVFVEKLLEY